MSELHDLTALEQAAAVRERSLSPIELTDHYLERIASMNEELGAFVTVSGEAARAAAQEAEVHARSGEPLPPLHGVPIGIKDLTATRGVRTTFGSVAGLHLVPDYDDDVVVSLRAAGTISLGKTNTSEWGLPNYTESLIAPPARNPWDLTRSAGGSSGGAAAAVAGGLLPFAHAMDGGGSIRIPASACGLVGIKPSRGRISNGPSSLDPGSLVHHGPIARTVRDGAALLDAMCDGSHGAVRLPSRQTFLAHADRDPGRLRIGRYCTNDRPELYLDPAVVDAYEATTTLLASLGHHVEEIAPPAVADSFVDFLTWWVAGPASVELSVEAEATLQPLTVWMRAQGATTSASTYLRAQEVARKIGRTVLESTSAYDAVLLPTVALPPQPIGAIRNDSDPEADFAAQARYSPFAALYNITGQPVVNVPVQWTPGGLPIGMSLAARMWDEANLIALAAQLESAQPWTGRRPDCW